MNQHRLAKQLIGLMMLCSGACSASGHHENRGLRADQPWLAAACSQQCCCLGVCRVHRLQERKPQEDPWLGRLDQVGIAEGLPGVLASGKGSRLPDTDGCVAIHSSQTFKLEGAACAQMLAGQASTSMSSIREPAAGRGGTLRIQKFAHRASGIAQRYHKARQAPTAKHLALPLHICALS